MSTGSSDILVRLDTSALESRLHGLTDQWEGQVRGMRHKVDDCSAAVRAVSSDVASIQQFLLSYHNREMAAVLMPPTQAGGGTATTTTTTTADPSGKSTAQSPDASSTENLLKMVTIARRLLADNEGLRTSLDTATAALASYNVTHDSLMQEVSRLRRLTASQTERLQSMSDWLGMSGLPIHETDGADSSNGSTSTAAGEHGEGAAPADSLAESTEAVLSRSPLLLSFRRFLLRDLTERLTSVVDQQSKDFHDSVAHLEGRIQTGQCIVTGVEAPPSGDATLDLQEAVAVLSKRVKELDQRAVKREEFTALMRSKADSLLLPVKADSADVSNLERRLATRCADLEERCAYADAERAEFRAILRSLIAAQTSPAGGTRPSGRTSPDLSTSGASPRGAASEKGAVLRDVLPALSHSPPFAAGAAVANSKTSSFHTPRGGPLSLASSTPPPQQLYRVVGTAAAQGVGVHGIPAAGATNGSSVQTVAAGSGTRRDPPRPQSTPMRSTDEGRVVIGMTSSQGDYANYVSQQLNRKQIAALPTLPYERLPSSQ